MMESSLTDSMEVCARVCLHMCVIPMVWEKITKLAPALVHALKWVTFDSMDIWYLTSLVTQLFDIRWGLQEHGSSKVHALWNVVSVALSYHGVKVIKYHFQPVLDIVVSSVCSQDGANTDGFHWSEVNRQITSASVFFFINTNRKCVRLVGRSMLKIWPTHPCLDLVFQLKTENVFSGAKGKKVCANKRS